MSKFRLATGITVSRAFTTPTMWTTTVTGWTTSIFLTTSTFFSRDRRITSSKVSLTTSITVFWRSTTPTIFTTTVTRRTFSIMLTTFTFYRSWSWFISSGSNWFLCRCRCWWSFCLFSSGNGFCNSCFFGNCCSRITEF